MSIRSGLDAQLGAAIETTYGTFVAPDHFYEFDKESMEPDIDYIESKAIRAGNLAQRSDRSVPVVKGAKGDIEMPILSKGFGLWLKLLHGAVAITTPMGGTNSHDQTFTLADPYGLFATVQIGKPDVGGTVRPFSWCGTKVVGAEISNDLDGVVMLKLSLDAREEKTDQTLATKSFPASTQMLTSKSGTVTIGGTAYSTKKISVKYTVKQDVERRFIDGSSLKKEPVLTDLFDVEVELEGEFEDLTQDGRWKAGTTHALFIGWTAPTVIEGALYPGLTITIPAAQIRGDAAKVEGPEILKQPLKLKMLNNGTDQPISVVYRTSDTTI